VADEGLVFFFPAFICFKKIIKNKKLLDYLQG
jgi:hypothetical protein